MEIKVNKICTFQDRTVIIVQLSEKRERVEIIDDLNTMRNPFWVDFSELTENPTKEIIDRHNLINKLFEQGKDINPILTENFVTFDIK